MASAGEGDQVTGGQGVASAGNGNQVTEGQASNQVTEGQAIEDKSFLDTDPYHYTKRGHFTSELFKIEIFNLPKYYGYVELKKLLLKLGLKPRKVKSIPKASIAFVTFNNEKERETALSAIKGHTWKKYKLDAKIAKPVVDPVTLKRKKEVEGREEEAKMPKLSIEESVSNAVTPLAGLPYEEQLDTKHRDMEEFLKALTSEFHREIPEMRKWLNLQRSKYGGKCCELERIKPSPIVDGYRNKCEFTIGKSSEGKDKTIGYRIGKYRDGFTAVASPLPCRNLPPACKKVVEHMQAYMDQSELEGVDPVTHEGHWGLLTVRTTEESDVMATLSLHLQDLTKEKFEVEKKKLKKYFSSTGPGSDAGITSLYLLLCGKGVKERGIPSKVCHISGNTHITENLLGLNFRVSQDAFFQGRGVFTTTSFKKSEFLLQFGWKLLTEEEGDALEEHDSSGYCFFVEVNTRAAEVLFQTAGDWAEVSEDTVLLDVCCGTGTIGLSLAKRVKRVVGVDLCQPAVEDARVNAQNNGVTNAKYICGKAEVVLPAVMDGISKSEMVVGVLDPPRAGLHMKVIQAVRKCEGLKRLVFLSCNPRLASSNFKDLCRPSSIRYKGTPFRLTKAVPVDLFPHAKHCELVLLFQREDEIKADGGTNSSAWSTAKNVEPVPESGSQTNETLACDSASEAMDTGSTTATSAVLTPESVNRSCDSTILDTEGQSKNVDTMEQCSEEPQNSDQTNGTLTCDSASTTVDTGSTGTDAVLAPESVNQSCDSSIRDTECSSKDVESVEQLSGKPSQ